MESNLKKLPLNDVHVQLGGKMVPFAGWYMPVQYEGVLKEHDTVRTKAGLFDISHMGEFLAEGKDVIPFIQKMVTNDLTLLENGKSQYACMCYENGTVVDDLIYYQQTPTSFRIIVNASNLEKDFKWFSDHLGKMDVKLTNLSSERCRFAFQGPKTQAFLQTLVDIDLSTQKRFYYKMTKIKNKSIFLGRTGYTGEDGFEISCENKDAKVIWNAILATGTSPIGLGARDSLRLEACLSLYGHEINDKITPIEANIGWAVKPKEGIAFTGKDILLKQKKEGTARTLVGVILKDAKSGIIREHYKVFKEKQEIGYITSGGWAQTLKKGVGLALIKKEFSKIGTEFEVEIRDKHLAAIVVATPFYKRDEAKK